jgi:hypothetical protein
VELSCLVTVATPPPPAHVIITAAEVTSSAKLEDYPVLLKSSGKLKGFVHRTMIDP